MAAAPAAFLRTGPVVTGRISARYAPDGDFRACPAHGVHAVRSPDGWLVESGITGSPFACPCRLLRSADRVTGRMTTNPLRNRSCRYPASPHAHPTPRPTQLLEMPFGSGSATEFTDEAACGEFLAQLPDAPSRFSRIGTHEPFRIRLKNVPLPGVSLLAGTQTPKAVDH